MVFSKTKRGRPIALTHHQIAELSEKFGADVSDRVQSMCEESFDAKTLGQLMRMLEAKLRAGGA